jgi:ADP-ribose diphosphatase
MVLKFANHVASNFLFHHIHRNQPAHRHGCAMSRPLPVIHGVVERAEGFDDRLVEELDLEFSNGERRRYHRMKAHGPGAVVVVPLLDDETVLLVREYAAGVHRYELGLVKGRMDEGETAEQAADRELKEEAGYGARRIDVLRTLSLAPTYMSHQSWLVLARDLYAEKLPGDEPEELDVVPWKLAQLDELMLREDFSEGRSLAALFIVREWLKQPR